MNTDKPDITEINVTDLQVRPFPSQLDFRISISERAYATIYNHAKENSVVEVCGVLIGDVFKDNQGPFLEISDAIIGEYSENKAGQVIFTHETWVHMNNVKDSEFPKKRIVGWYHTHPQFGIFLSPQDLFIHENFFNLPWQTAFVIDPVSEDEGFFVWHKGKLNRIEQYWIGEKKKITMGDVKVSRNKTINMLDDVVETVLKRTKRGLQPLHVLISLLIITALVVAYLLKVENNFRREAISTKITSPNLAERFEKLERIRSALSKNEILSGLDIKCEQQEDRIWCDGEVYTGYQKDLVKKVVNSVENIGPVDLHGLFVNPLYTPLPGDNLSKISAKVYGDPNKWTYIFRANQHLIKNPDTIYPFFPLLLPGEIPKVKPEE